MHARIFPVGVQRRAKVEGVATVANNPIQKGVCNMQLYGAACHLGDGSWFGQAFPSLRPGSVEPEPWPICLGATIEQLKNHHLPLNNELGAKFSKQIRHGLENSGIVH